MPQPNEIISAPTRRTVLRDTALAAGAAAFAPALSRALAAPGPAKPNIVFFLGEGARPDESSLAGNKLLHTPHIDRIGREGAVFNNGFCVNALCAPSRASILSGLYSHTSGALDNGHNKVPASVPLVSDLLHDNGYETAFLGKSHVDGALTDRYWDYYFGFRGQANYFKPVVTEGIRGKYGEARQYDAYVDDLLTDKAVEWLKQPRQKPFCLFLWFYAPHSPFYRPLRMVNDFNGVPIPKPRSFDEYLAGYRGKPKAVVDALNKVGAQFFDFDQIRSLEELVKNHYCGIQSNDEDMARIFSVLEAQGAMDDTAVLWSSDHGFFLGEHRFYDKRLMYEPSIRIPFMIRYPKRVRPGMVRDQMVLNLDLPPTLLDLAGIPVPSSFEGRSVMPLLETKDAPWRKDWLYEYYEYPGYEQVRPCRGVRTERFKFIHYYLEPEEFELYDLQEDPDEMHNLYGDAQHAALARELAARLQQLRAETGDRGK